MTSFQLLNIHDMAYRTLWKRQCDSGKEESVRLYPLVFIVCIEIFELFVSQIGHANREEPVPPGKTVIDCGIEEHEVIVTFLKGSCSRYWLKMAILMYIGPCERGTQSRGVEKIDPQRYIVGLHRSCAIRKVSTPFKPLP